MELTKVEKDKLSECEAVIEQGLNAFLETGLALATIKNEQLYKADFTSFEAYCDERWGISRSKGNYLSSIGDIMRTLPENVPVPEKPHHLKQLEILTDDHQRENAWVEANRLAEQTNTQLRAKHVKNAALKQLVLNGQSVRLREALIQGEIGVQNAYQIYEAFYLKKQYPDIFVKAFERWGGQYATYTALAELALNWQDEATSILISGILDNGREQIHLGNLERSEVEAYNRKLFWEQSQAKKLELAKQQKKRLAKQTILNGFEILEANLEASQMVYLFPEGNVPTKQLLNKLEQSGKEILFLVAYDRQDEPTLLFDQMTGETIKASAINGLKPYPITDMIKTLQI